MINQEMNNKMNAILDKFSAYYSSKNNVETERTIKPQTATVKGREREIFVGEIIFSMPVAENEKLGNDGITNKYMMVEIKPQVGSYTVSYKFERKGCSDRNFNGTRNIQSDVLSAIAKM